MSPSVGAGRRLPSIGLQDVSQDMVDEKHGRRLAMKRVSAMLRADCNVAVMGAEPDMLTNFLHLLAGSSVPDSGSISVTGLKFSPIANAGGIPAGTLLPKLNALENIRFFANLHEIDGAALVHVVDLACGLGPRLQEPLSKLDGITRRSLEIALIAALPYDCYLIDRFESLLPEFRWLMAHSVRARSANMIFATTDIRLAKQFGGVGLVIENGKLRPHPDLVPGFRSTPRSNKMQGARLHG